MYSTMQTCPTPFHFPHCLLVFTFCASIQSLSAQTVNCDTVPVVAQASVNHMTCDEPEGTLTGLLHPTALKYHWYGPGGFSAAQRVIQRPVEGQYLLIVTGPYGCTAQTLVTLADNCLEYPLFPAPCPDPFVPPVDDCEEVCVREYLPGFYLFNNYNASLSLAPWPCGTIENDQWFAFVAPDSAVSITAQALNCQVHDGIQLGLYGDCHAPPIVCNGGAMQGENFEITIADTSLIPGKVYFLQVDGWAGDKCEYFFPTDSIGGDPDTLYVYPNVTGLNHACPGATVQYTLNDPPFATAFLWTGPPGTLFNGLASPALFYVPDGKKVDITFGSDTGFICVRAINYFRPPSPPLCVDVYLDPIPATVLPEVEVCWEAAPYELPWGDQAFITGNYEYTYSSYLGCDSLVRQPVKILVPKVNMLPPIYLCVGACFEIGGTQYCEAGYYSHILTTDQGCDSIVNFPLFILNLIADIQGAGVLTCNKPIITLKSANPASQIYWKNLAGTILASGNTLQVTAPGTYILELIETEGGSTCTDRDTVVIERDIMPPLLQVENPGILTCAVTELSLLGSSSDSLASFLWTGPNGFTSSFLVASVNTPGLYTLKVTGLNGCTTTTTVTVVADQTPPIINIQGGMLSCMQTSVYLQVLNDLPFGGQYFWTGPNGFTSAQSQPEVMEPGMYILTFLNSINGCSAQDSVLVLADFTLPPVDVLQQAPECGDSLLLVDATSGFPGALIDWFGPGNFTAQGGHIEVSEPGWYLVQASTANGCHSQISVLVVAAPQSPEVSLSGASLINCITTSIPIQTQVDIPGSTFKWAGPGGFTSNFAEPLLPLPGDYQLLVTAPSGCTATATYQIEADTVRPVVTVSGGELTCDKPEFTLFAVCTPPDAFFNWTWQLFSLNGNPITVSEPEIYLVLATLPNGCTGTATAEVVDSCLVRTLDPELAGAGILLYPNPSSGLVTVESLDKTPFSAVRVFSVDGALLRQEQFDFPSALIQLDLSEHPPGVYVLAAQIQDRWYFEIFILLE